MIAIRILTTLALLSFTPATFAQDASAVFPKAGFTIKPLDPEIGKAAQFIAMFYLQATDGFSPNVNVMAIPAPKGMAGFIEATKKEFEAGKQTITSQNFPDEQTWVFEAKGKRESRDLHFYARATLKGSTIYLATGTAMESQWATVGAPLKASVESLRSK